MTDWMHAVVQWPLGVSVISVVALSVVVPWLAVSLVRRIWPHPVFKENNELVGFTYAVYGLIYGVFLAFIIVVAQDQSTGKKSVRFTDDAHLGSSGDRNWYRIP